MAVAALVGLSAVLGVYRIADKSLWLDEALTAAMAVMSPAEIVDATYRTPTPGAIVLYYLLVHLWATVAGTSELALRLFSTIAFVAAIPVVYALGRWIAGERAALLGALVMALSPFGVSYAQEARPYGLIVLLVAASSLALVRAVDQPTRTRWAIYVILAVAALYVHNTAAFTLAAHGAWALSRMSLRRLAVVYGAIGVAALPLAGLLSTGPFDWIAAPSPESVWLVLRLVTGGTGLALTAIALTAFGAWRNRSGLALALLLVPVALELVVSLWRPMFIDRYLVVVLPGLALCIGAGLAALPHAPLRWAAAGVIVALSLSALFRLYSSPAKEGQDWRGVVALIDAEEEPGDSIIVAPADYHLPFDYYAARAGLDAEHGLGERVWFVSLGDRPLPAGYRLARDRSVWSIRVRLTVEIDNGPR